MGATRSEVDRPCARSLTVSPATATPPTGAAFGRRPRLGTPSVVAIPGFDKRGNLPPGRHEASRDEVVAVLVDAFPTSRTRSAIAAYWQHHLEAVTDLVPVRLQLLGGSFATNKPDPADADVLTVLDGPAFDALPTHRQLLLRALMAGHYTESFWSCDVHPLAAYPEDHPGHSKYLIALERLEAYLGHDRDGVACGLVAVPL